MPERTLMLDASTLVSMSRDDRGRAAEILAQVRDRGWLTVLTGHQFVELLCHENDAEAERRLEFLQWLSAQPGMAWLAAGPQWDSLGMIPNVTSWEVKGIAEGVQQAELRSYVLSKLFRTTAPPAVEFSDLATLRPVFHERMRREREIASIVRADGVDFGSDTIGEQRKRGARSKEAARSRILQQAELLAEKISRTGDKRIGDPLAVAHAFLSTAADDVPDEILPGESPADALIRSFGVDPARIPDDMTSTEFGYYAEFQTKIRLAGQQVGVDPTLLIDISLERVPTCLIQYLLRLARVKSGARASGSDVADSYLASMTYYIDLVIADKRTTELMAQVRRDPRVGHLGATRRAIGSEGVIAALEVPVV